MSPKLQLNDFDYDYPANLVAHQPAAQRSSSKLLVSHANKPTQHAEFHELFDWLPAESLVVVNNSRVIPSRLHAFRETGGKIEVFLLSNPFQKSDDSIAVTAMARPMKRLRAGEVLTFTDGLTGRISQIEREQMRVEILFANSLEDFMTWMEHHGNVPLPPYIKRDGELETDKERYQTVYSQEKGSVAAPTAGLHFTPQLMDEGRKKGFDFAEVTLHVGAGTFLPVKSAEPSAHKMHSESYSLTQSAWKKILQAKEEGRPIVAVGTTSFRCLESFAQKSREIQDLYRLCDQVWETDLFIYPEEKTDRYHPKLVNGLVTNFHLPKSTLIMLVSALVGYDRCMALYREAVAKKYRLFSYGDSSLLSW